MEKRRIVAYYRVSTRQQGEREAAGAAYDDQGFVIAHRLDHSTVTLTLDTYSHVLPRIQRAAADQLEQMLFG